MPEHSIFTKQLIQMPSVVYYIPMIEFGGGGVIDGILKFISSNIVAIVTIIITLLGIGGTPYYIRSRVNSAQQERYNQAKSNFLDIIEEQLINEHDITEKRLSNLRSAIERRYSVSISDRLSTVELLQDLQLRIEESKLDSDVKQQYTEIIESTIDEIKETRQFEDLPFEYQAAIEELNELDDVSPSTLVERIEEARVGRRVESSSTFLEMFRIAFNPSRLDELPPDVKRNVRRRMLFAALVYLTFLIIVIVFTPLF